MDHQRSMSMILIGFLLIFATVVTEGVEGADSHFTLLEIRCDGTLTTASSQVSRQVIEKKWLGDVQKGILFGDHFYAIDPAKKERLLVTNLRSMKSGHLDLAFPLDKPFRLWSVEFVDERRIIINAYRPDKTPIGKERLYYPFELDRHSGTVREIPIPDYGGTISVHDNAIYYSSIRDQICTYDDSHGARILGFKGRTPTISPDGSRLAFITFGIMTDGVNVYDLRTKRIHSVIRFFGPKAVMPILRWSQDGQFIAVKKQNDLFSSALYVLNATRGTVIDAFTKSGACNWFFVEW